MAMSSQKIQPTAILMAAAHIFTAARGGVHGENEYHEEADRIYAARQAVLLAEQVAQAIEAWEQKTEFEKARLSNPSKKG